MLVFMIHAGIYDSCWYLQRMLVFMIHAGIYDSCRYLQRMLVFRIDAGNYDSCWYLLTYNLIHVLVYGALFRAAPLFSILALLLPL